MVEAHLLHQSNSPIIKLQVPCPNRARERERERDDIQYVYIYICLTWKKQIHQNWSLNTVRVAAEAQGQIVSNWSKERYATVDFFKDVESSEVRNFITAPGLDTDQFSKATSRRRDSSLSENLTRLTLRFSRVIWILLSCVQTKEAKRTEPPEFG